MPFLAIFTIAAWFGMNDLATSKASIKEQLPVLKRGHLWIMSLLYLATSAPSSASPRALRCCQKRSSRMFRFCNTLSSGPFIGALARSAGGALSDRLGGTRVTLVNFILMAIFSGLLFLTLPTDGQGGSFMAFFAVFLALFLTAGLGSGSTFQMISVIFRKLTMDRVKAEGVLTNVRCVKRQPTRRRRWVSSLRLARLVASLSRKRLVARWH